VMQAPKNGFFYVLDAKTGKLIWEHDSLTNIWGSCFYVDGKIYVGTEEGDILIFAAGRECKPLGKIDMQAPVLSTPVAMNGVLYVMTKNRLYAITNKE
ncbi:MAG TPA: PQQ-binding-like beta-propeller repeat protein, partial [Gemmatales bacterium]|nr:PQQ-binding-like beta-propeller repeat protein [Gemmatales bacterium]